MMISNNRKNARSYRSWKQRPAGDDFYQGRYSLRHTYICRRLLEGADIYQLAKKRRTSVEMIEKHFAVHLKNTLDAAAINVRKPKIRQRKDQDKEKA